MHVMFLIPKFQLVNLCTWR